MPFCHLVGFLTVVAGIVIYVVGAGYPRDGNHAIGLGLSFGGCFVALLGLALCCLGIRNGECDSFYGILCCCLDVSSAPTGTSIPYTPSVSAPIPPSVPLPDPVYIHPPVNMDNHRYRG